MGKTDVRKGIESLMKLVARGDYILRKRIK